MQPGKQLPNRDANLILTAETHRHTAKLRTRLVQGFIDVVLPRGSFFSAHSAKVPSSCLIKHYVRAGRVFFSQILQDLPLTETASLPSSEFGMAEIMELLTVLKGKP